MNKTIIALTIVMLTQSFSWAGIQFDTQSTGQSYFVQHQLYALHRLHGLIDQNSIKTVQDPYDIMIKMSLSQPDPNTAHWLFKIAKIIKKVERNEQIAFVSILYHHSQKTNNTQREEIFHTILKRSIKRIKPIQEGKEKKKEKEQTKNKKAQNSEDNFAELTNLINGLLDL